MGIRPRSLLIFTALAVIPLAALSFAGRWYGVRAVEAELRRGLERDAWAVARDLEARLRDNEEDMAELARSDAARDFVKAARPLASEEEMPKDLLADARALLEQGGRRHYAALAYYGVSRRPLLVARPNFKVAPPVIFDTDESRASLVQPDERVWAAPSPTPLRSQPLREAYGTALRYTLPVFTNAAGEREPRGALVVDLNLDSVLSEAAAGVAGTAEVAQSQRTVLVLDAAGGVQFHPNVALKYQQVSRAMPQLAQLLPSMKEGLTDCQFYDSTEGDRWLACYRPLGSLGLSVAVAANHSAAVRGTNRVGWLLTGLGVLVGLLMGGLLWAGLRRTARRIESVTEDAVAIAGGRLDQHIEVRSSDETRLLAESFNVMTDRLREQIAREAEARQFQSFIRLSAMLTHDLKNSILSLSLLVQNMEQQSHREEFRAEAMKSLTEATDKLRALVARLSEPVRSLSGEFRLPRPVDLVPAIRRAVAASSPSHAEHELSVELPERLVAVADEERVERVLENLLLNALEAMGARKGKLTVRAGLAEEGSVFFSVSDTGVGMTEEFRREKLFRPFSTTKANGIGLGLYASRELIRALGGRIEVESARGVGTTFRVVLPSGQAAEKG